jgi:hypothetical protein
VASAVVILWPAVLIFTTLVLVAAAQSETLGCLIIMVVAELACMLLTTNQVEQVAKAELLFMQDRKFNL